MAEQSEDGPTLYMFPGSYFSQLAMLALHEKGVKYTPYFVRLHELDHMQPWFLKLNPKSQIPVLKDQDGKSVPGSDQIFLYLEERYDADHFPKLLPPKDTAEFQSVEKFDQLLRTFSNAGITFGLIRFPQLSSGIRVPEYEQQIRKGGMIRMEERLQQLVQSYPELATLVAEKQKGKEMFLKLAGDVEAVQGAIASTASLLDQVEHELSLHVEGRKDWWLCSDKFTTADVILAVVLQRLDIVGLSSSLLDPIKRPLLVAYKAKLEQRPTYREYLAAVEELHQRCQSLENVK